MKRKRIWLETIVDFYFLILFLLFFFFVIKNRINNLKTGIEIISWSIVAIIIVLHEKRYRENYPFKTRKNNPLNKRITSGLMAGFHYVFFIGTYSHKKYNTQVWYPETLECVIGNMVAITITVIYLIIGVYLFRSIGYYTIFFLVIPILTNTISLLIKNR